MGVGMPMATQVKRTVSPREATMLSSGGVITCGGPKDKEITVTLSAMKTGYRQTVDTTNVD